MRTRFLWLAAALCVAAPLCAQNPPASWEGLSGLLSAPSARVLPGGHYTGMFSEHRHQEYLQGQRVEDRFIIGTGNFGFGDRWEMSFGVLKQLVQWGPLQAQAGAPKDADTYFLAHFKRQITPDRGKGALAIGVRDVLDRTRHYRGTFPDTGRGRKAFLVWTRSLRLGQKPETCPCEVNIGLTYDRSGPGCFLGVNIPVVPQLALAAEVNTDSTFHDFEDAFSANPEGETTVNLGVRVFPESVPGMVVDITSLGDSDFAFAFAVSYGK
jgi:hypothetical protein